MGREIHICRPGVEHTLTRELTSLGVAGCTARPGHVICDDTGGSLDCDLCFATLSLLDPVQVNGQSVNALAGAVCDAFGDAMRGVRIDQPWYLHWDCAPDDALRRRCASVAREFGKKLRNRMGRVARLASQTPPPDAAPRQGLVAYLVAPDRLFAATRLRCWGQRRMRLHPRAPSRSYLKIEEAFALLGDAPKPGDAVVDLGAAPGGWSFSAAARGAEVYAVDNGPLKGAAHEHDSIYHCREDAFSFRMPRGQTADWLLCDLIENPKRVVEGILLPWLDQKRCRQFVVNLKTGRLDPVELLARLRQNGTWSLTHRCARATVRHLYHDRDELTCMGISSADSK